MGIISCIKLEQKIKKEFEDYLINEYDVFEEDYKNISEDQMNEYIANFWSDEFVKFEEETNSELIYDIYYNSEYDEIFVTVKAAL